MIIAHFSAKPAYFQGNQIHSVGVHRVLWAAGIRCCALNVRQGIPGYWSDERLSKERLLLSGHSAPCACHLCVFTIYQIETRVTTGTSITLQWRLKILGKVFCQPSTKQVQIQSGCFWAIIQCAFHCSIWNVQEFFRFFNLPFTIAFKTAADWRWPKKSRIPFLESWRYDFVQSTWHGTLLKLQQGPFCCVTSVCTAVTKWNGNRKALPKFVLQI